MSKYGDAEKVARRLEMEEERKKMTPSLRLKILERDKFTCQLCGRTPPEIKLTVDHKYPVDKGGKTEEGNLWALCWDCNAGKGAKIIELPEWA